jgi:hypothetical protein
VAQDRDPGAGPSAGVSVHLVPPGVAWREPVALAYAANLTVSGADNRTITVEPRGRCTF